MPVTAVQTRASRAVGGHWLGRRRASVTLLIVAVAAAGLPVLTSAPAQAAVTTSSFVATADSRVEKSAPATNYGSATSLTADASPVVESYLRFAPSIKGTLRRAVVRVHASNGSVDGPALYATASTWTESGLTWSNRPSRSGTPLGDAAAVGTNAWIEYDVTAAVQSGKRDFVLASTASDGTTVHSRQSTSTSLRPTLVVTVDDGVAAPTAPVNTTAPSITGTAQEGRALTASPGTWSGEPTGYAYAWSRCAAACVASGAGPSYTLTAADVGATVRVAVTATNAQGSSTAVSAPTAVVTAAPPASAGDPVIAAAGDIACDPTDPSFNGGLGTATACRQMATSDLLTGGDLTAVLTLGDLQYGCGGAAAFAQSYDPSWGRVRGITRPAVGNHEYYTTGGMDCDTTGKAAGYFGYFGAAAGEPTKGYYSYEIGAWHVVALNSNCTQAGGCGAGSPQETWLRQDLAAHPTTCTLAYWHHPLSTSGKYAPGVSAAKPLYQALYDHRADVVLAGHDHLYERFAPQNPAGGLDLATGLRQFVVGTGGKKRYGLTTPAPNSEFRSADVDGVLKLTLRPTSSDWRFVTVAGEVLDAGTDSCEGSAPDSQAPSAPPALTASAASAAQVDLRWTAATDDVGVVGYDIHRNGALLATTKTVLTTFSDPTASPATAYTYEVRSRDAAGNRSSVAARADVTTPAGQVVAYPASGDATVSEATPAVSSGTGALRVDGGAGTRVESLLSFTPAGITGPVQSAKLRVYATTGTVDGPAVRAVGNGWTESTATWDSTRSVAAAAGPVLGDKAAVPAASWLEYDVTSAVQADGSYSFWLASASTDGIDLSSREAAADQPRLVVTFGPPPT